MNTTNKLLLRFLFLTSLLCRLTAVTPIQAQTRRALIIGLGEQLDPQWGRINGNKDVLYVKHMLKRARYQDVQTLIDREATKKGIVQAFNSLTKRCTKGDVVYIHFSGHGQLVTDTNGDENANHTNKYPDKWDEAWIPYDAYLRYGPHDRGEKHLIDDELNQLLNALKNRVGENGKILVVVDACHSGDSTRGDDDDAENAEDIAPVRGVRQTFDIPLKQHEQAAAGPVRWLTLSACRDIQKNQELRKPQVGKLTYILYKLTSKPHLSFEAIAAQMSQYNGNIPQTPVLSGNTKKYKLSDFF